MALQKAQIRPQLNEKRQLTLDFLEASVMQGSEVEITPVTDTEITELSGENFEYGPSVKTFITFDERPSVKLLRSYGWYREDAEIQPIIAYIPTHLLYNKREDNNTPTPSDIANFLKLEGNEYQALVNVGESENYILLPLRVVRGTLVDIYYDFLPDKVNKFYAVDVKVDTVSINYVVNLMPYRHDKEPEGRPESSTPRLDIDTRKEKL